jgi:hypothetical protein
MRLITSASNPMRAKSEGVREEWPKGSICHPTRGTTPNVRCKKSCPSVTYFFLNIRQCTFPTISPSSLFGACAVKIGIYLSSCTHPPANYPFFTSTRPQTCTHEHPISYLIDDNVKIGICLVVLHPPASHEFQLPFLHDLLHGITRVLPLLVIP